MKRHTVLIIGTGQLGSRHLQGLGKSRLLMDVLLCDPSNENLDIAVSRFMEINPNDNIKIFGKYNSIDEIETRDIDLAIIATNANVRFEITKQLLSGHNVSNIIFEKVAFQSEKQFITIINFLASRSVKSWVNCARRYFPGYRKLAEELSSQQNINFSLSGTDWGLACNSVHFLDLFTFLTESTSPKIENFQLAPYVYSSKRKGFIELFGIFSGNGAKNSRFSIECMTKSSDQQEVLPPIIEITFNSQTVRINESKDSIEYFSEGSQVPSYIEPLGLLYQSQLTSIQAEDILCGSTSLLPTIEESFAVHRQVLEVFLKHYDSINGTVSEVLPIT